MYRSPNLGSTEAVMLAQLLHYYLTEVAPKIAPSRIRRNIWMRLSFSPESAESALHWAGADIPISQVVAGTANNKK